MFKRILIAVDESTCSEQAVRFGTGLAGRMGATVTLVHVIEPRGFASSDLAWLLYQQRREHGEALLKRYADQASSMDTRLVEADSITAAIAHLAVQGGFDLMLVGTHGRSGLGRVLLGSVAEGIARRSPIPVLLIRPETEGLEVRKVIATTDGSLLSSDALGAARGLAQALDAQLLVLHVVPDAGLPPAVGATPIDSSAVQRDLELQGKGIVNEAIRELGYARAQPVLVHSHGRAVHEVIAQTAQDRDADLIVMGTHGRSGLDRLLLGSVAQQVMHRAHVPVLLVRSGQTVTNHQTPWTSTNERGHNGLEGGRAG